MKNSDKTGVYQMANGNWGYRYGVVVDGKTVWRKKARDQNGNVMKTKSAAVKARKLSIADTLNHKAVSKKMQPAVRKTMAAVYNEYCESGRKGKAYETIRKQDSLWRNHLKDLYGERYIDDISVAEIVDYLTILYYDEGRAYGYVESFLKMFYLIFGQAYSRNYLDVDTYNKLCVNKSTRIHMPKMKIDEEQDIVVFSRSELECLDDYFCGTNAETAYLIGRYCGVRINECYGLKWSDLDLENGTIRIERQMQYQNGVIKLVPLKTRNARRTLYMSPQLKDYLKRLWKKKEEWESELADARQQNQIFIEDTDGEFISSLDLVNSLENGKRQTVNSMKYHAKKIQSDLGIHFKYHYLRHTYGTHLANLNTPAHILRTQMGHANLNVTMKYYVTLSEEGITVLTDNLSKMV